jgi:hypothetical protein
LFDANEGNEPLYVHCRNYKYWLKKEIFDIEEAFSHNMKQKDHLQETEKLHDKRA